MLLAPETVSSTPQKAIECTPDGIWHIRGYAEAKQIMLMDVTQAGFYAELVMNIPGNVVEPVLWLDGEDHKEQRKQIAKFFAPTMTTDHHSPIMIRHAEQKIEEFLKTGKADLSKIATELATGVVAEIVGLTESTRPGLSERMDKVLHIAAGLGLSLRGFWSFLLLQWLVTWFWQYDVLPAVKARKVQPRTDVISHLVAKKANRIVIIADCLTYGIAGVTTTRELISIAFWHCMKRPDLRAIMVGDDKEARFQLLYELLRVDPIVALLHRRASVDLVIESNDETITIPAKSMIIFHIRDINTDPRAVAEGALMINPSRHLEPRIPRAVMAFGSGVHHCPGEFIAITEADIFLNRFLKIDDLCIDHEPDQEFNEAFSGYELRHFLVGRERPSAN